MCEIKSFDSGVWISYFVSEVDYEIAMLCSAGGARAKPNRRSCQRACDATVHGICEATISFYYIIINLIINFKNKKI